MIVFIFHEMNKTNLGVRVIFTSNNDTLSIKIINNISIVPEELTKINVRLKKAFE